MNAVGGDRGDVRLSGEMQALMKGRKYVKESELTRQVLLEYAKQKGAVKLVELVRVQVEQFGGSSFVAVLDDTESKVRDLKRAIEDKQGVLRRFQALFLLDDNGGLMLSVLFEPSRPSRVVGVCHGVCAF